MRGLLGILGAFGGDSADDRKRPDANVGMAFLIAAVVVALAGLKWMGSGDDDGSSEADGWALGGTPAAADESGDLIPASSPAVAVRIGAENPGAGPESRDTPSTRPGSTVTTILPDGTVVVIDDGTGVAGPGSSGSTPTTHTTTSTLEGPTTTEDTTTTSEDTTTTTEDTTTTSETTTTTEVAPAPNPGESPSGGLLGGVVVLLGLRL